MMQVWHIGLLSHCRWGKHLKQSAGEHEIERLEPNGGVHLRPDLAQAKNIEDARLVNLGGSDVRKAHSQQRSCPGKRFRGKTRHIGDSASVAHHAALARRERDRPMSEAPDVAGQRLAAHAASVERGADAQKRERLEQPGRADGGSVLGVGGRKHIKSRMGKREQLRDLKPRLGDAVEQLGYGGRAGGKLHALPQRSVAGDQPCFLDDIERTALRQQHIGLRTELQTGTELAGRLSGPLRNSADLRPILRKQGQDQIRLPQLGLAQDQDARIVGALRHRAT